MPENGNKVKVVIVGSGNIGMDLMYKVKRSPLLEVGMIIGIDPASEGLALAAREGVPFTARGLAELEENPDLGEIVFDATTARAHHMHAPVLKRLGKIAIDLTPASIGERVVPVVNLDRHLDKDNVCLITCGGQAVIPVISAVNSVAPVSYAEIVSTVSSKSAGPGTRQNIDEFTHTTRRAIVEVGGAKTGKAIMLLNPAEPPIMMHNTIYCQVEDVDEAGISAAVADIVGRVSQYVPGYRLKVPPLFDGNKVTIMLEVTGAGDYLPKYAGNLDIMTCAAVATAEAFTQQIFQKNDRGVE